MLLGLAAVISSVAGLIWSLRRKRWGKPCDPADQRLRRQACL